MTQRTYSEIGGYLGEEGARDMRYMVFVYHDDLETGSKLVEWYHVASAFFEQPEIKVPDGYRAWVSSVQDAVKAWS